MNKFLKFTLFFLLTSLFISSRVFADSPDDFLKRREISIDSNIDIDVLLEHSKNTTGDSLMPIIFSENKAEYLKLSDHLFFRVVDSSVELISVSSESTPVLWKKDFNDLFLPKILVMDNYLIVSGEFFSYDFDLFQELNLSKPISVVKIFDISDLDKIKLSKEFLLPGSFKACVPVEKSVMLFTDFATGADSNVRFPYYIAENEKHHFSLDNLLKMDGSDSPSYINALKISLSDKPEVASYKSLLGFGSTLSFSEDSLFLRSFENDYTRISKLNLNGDWFTNNHSISVPGVINSDDSFNIFDGNIQIVTSVFKENKDTFNVYFLDESLNLMDSFTKFGSGFIQDVYPLNNKLLINYSNSSSNSQESWMNFQFDSDYSLKTLPLNDFNYSNSFITSNNIFSFDSSHSNKMELIVRDNNHTVINRMFISNNNLIFPSSHIIAHSNDDNYIAIPVVVDGDSKSHGMFIFKDSTTSPSMDLITDDISEANSYSIDGTPEFLQFQGDKLYAFSREFISIYNLSTNKLESKISLKY